MIPLPALAAAPLKLKPLAPIYDNSNSAPKQSSSSSRSRPDLPEPQEAPSYASRTHNDYTDPAADSDSSYQQATSSGSDREKELLRSAISAHQSGNTAKAEQLFRQVLQLNANSTDAHFSLGAIAESKGDLDGAEQHYKIALRSSPDDGEIQDAVNALAGKKRERIASQARRQEQQRQIAEQEQKTAQLKRLTENAARAYKDGKYDIAIGNLEQVARQAPNDPDVQYALAQAYRGKGDLDQARYHISQALSDDPNNQMYRAVLNGINEDSSAAGSQNRNQYADNRGSRAPYSPQVANGAYDGQPVGQLNPITPEANPPRRNMEYGYATAGGGLGGLGGLLPGVVGMGVGTGFGGRSYGGSSTRMRRAVQGGLAGAVSGAAMAAMFNRRPGSVKQGALRGALLGGMAGFIFGGN